MTDEREEFVLGEDVTAAAAAKSRRETGVLSVRFSIEELGQIESVSLATGKTVSQVVREAVGTFLRFERHNQPTVTISIAHRGTFSVGSSGQRSSGTPVEGNLVTA